MGRTQTQRRNCWNYCGGKKYRRHFSASANASRRILKSQGKSFALVICWKIIPTRTAFFSIFFLSNIYKQNCSKRKPRLKKFRAARQIFFGRQSDCRIRESSKR